MKKFLLLISAVILSNCNIEPHKVNAEQNHYSMKYATYSTRDEYYQGMHYIVWYATTGNPYGGPAVHSINLTKDSLECAYYRSKLK